MTKARPLRIGISRCLLGDPVRYDGGHKRNSFLTETLSRHVEWVLVCPEVEIGLGTPREAMRLVGDAKASRLITIKTGLDHTRAMETFSRRRVRELEAMDLSGYVFKKDSPSCGMERVRLYNQHGMPRGKGIGLFARAFMEHFPQIPVEDEGRLSDPDVQENFLEQVSCYHRRQGLLRGSVTRKAMVDFHAKHKYLLLAHSPEHYHALGRLVANAKRYALTKLASRYSAQFMKAIKVKASVRKHVNVLNHMAAYFHDRLSPEETNELHSAINDYHKGLIPLIVPTTLIKHYVRVFGITYLQNQVYLNPHHKELMLRNRV